jgi:hypothetical protein
MLVERQGRAEVAFGYPSSFSISAMTISDAAD